VIDEKTAADPGTGVDVYAGFRVRQFRGHPCQQRQIVAVELVGDTVVNHGLYAGVAQQYFVYCPGRRVSPVGRQHIGIKQAADGGQGGGKVLHGLVRPRGYLIRLRVFMTQAVAQFQPRLRQQRMQRRPQGVADVIIFVVVAQVYRPQPHGKERPLQFQHDGGNRFA